MSAPSLADRIRSPRTATIANLALVMTGSVLALLSVVDIVTGVLLVTIGFAGVLVSLVGLRTADAGHD
ncbi:hypothetical protein [Natronorubrum sp. DTA7]|uniref:hypothetical protein n=1 Tax=Natronorubrum sp. DTA7 TaxID=3447016 RepID=UPI003F83FE66